MVGCTIKHKKVAYAGIGLWSIGLLVILYLGQLELSARSMLFTELPLPFLLPYAILVAPILEEILFRSILLDNKRRSALVLAVLFYVTLPIVYSKSYLYLFSILVPVIALFAPFNTFLSKNKSTLLLVATATCFALAHLEAFVVHSIFEFILYLGIGLVLGVVVINKGLKYAVALHAVYNLLLCVPWIMILVGSFLQKPMAINTDQIKGSISYSSHQLQLGSSSYLMNDSIGASNTPLQDIAFRLVRCENCLKVRNGSPYRKVNMTLTSVGNDSSSTLVADALHYLQHQQLVDLDTTHAESQAYYAMQKQSNCACERKRYTPSSDLSRRYIGTRGLIEYIY